MELDEIKRLAEQDHYEEALAKCEELLNGIPEKKTEILRVRAYVFALLGDYESALKDREAIFKMDKGILKDYFLAADNALELGDFIRAVGWLKKLLRLGKEHNETWFESSAYFLLAYAQMELGHYDDAIVDLDCAISLEANCSMFLPNLGMWDHNRLKEEIHRRAKEKI